MSASASNSELGETIHLVCLYTNYANCLSNMAKSNPGTHGTHIINFSIN